MIWQNINPPNRLNSFCFPRGSPKYSTLLTVFLLFRSRQQNHPKGSSDIFTNAGIGSCSFDRLLDHRHTNITATALALHYAGPGTELEKSSGSELHDPWRLEVVSSPLLPRYFFSAGIKDCSQMWLSKERLKSLQTFMIAFKLVHYFKC